LGLELFRFLFGLFELCLVSIKGIHLFPSEPWRETNLSPKIKTKHQTKKKREKRTRLSDQDQAKAGREKVETSSSKHDFFVISASITKCQAPSNPQKRPPSQSNKKEDRTSPLKLGEDSIATRILEATRPPNQLRTRCPCVPDFFFPIQKEEGKKKER
jgi:hypothetical protein